MHGCIKNHVHCWPLVPSLPPARCPSRETKLMQCIHPFGLELYLIYIYYYYYYIYIYRDVC